MFVCLCTFIESFLHIHMQMSKVQVQQTKQAILLVPIYCYKYETHIHTCILTNLQAIV